MDSIHYNEFSVDIDASRIEDEHRAHRARHLLALVRLGMAWMFLWAFLDRTFGLGLPTESASAWIRGGSPTTDLLDVGTQGRVFHALFVDLSGPVADWPAMLGLLGIGLALLFGIGMRIATATGVTMLILMWMASLPLEGNPILDHHLVYALLLVIMTVYGAGRTFGLGRRWEELSLVRRFPFLE